MVSSWDGQDWGKGIFGLHSGLGLKFGRFSFHQKLGCPSSRLAFCLGQKVRRRVKTTCFGGVKYIFVLDQLYICLSFHKMKLKIY